MQPTRSRTKRELDWHALHERLARLALDPDRIGSSDAAAVLEQRARQLARRPDPSAARPKLELVGFGLCDERYAIEVRYVFSVLRLTELARLPGAPEHVLGVTSLRGEILPVFDLRVLLGVPRVGLGDLSRLLVLGVERAGLGIVADAVHELQAIDSEAALEPPESIAGIGRKYLRGVTAEALIVLDGRALLEEESLFIGSPGKAPGENR